MTEKMNKNYLVAITVVILFIVIVFVALFFCFAPRHQVRAAVRTCRRMLGQKEEEEQEMTNPSGNVNADSSQL